VEKRDDIFLILMVVAVFTVQCCASTVYAMALCPSVSVSDNPSQASVLSRQLDLSLCKQGLYSFREPNILRNSSSVMSFTKRAHTHTHT